MIGEHLDSMPMFHKEREIPPLIWILDSDTKSAYSLMQQLESLNYGVQLFSHIEFFKISLKTKQPDICLLNSSDALDQVENVTSEVHASSLQTLNFPLLIISDHDDFLSRVRAVRQGAKGYMLKPIDMPRVVNLIDQILEQKDEQPQRVLVVDDDPLIAEHTRLILMQASMEVEILRVPEYIMDVIARFRPELVLMALDMPEFSGTDLVGVIRQYEYCANLPIIYLSSEQVAERQVKSMAQDSDEFLTRPLSELQLVTTVRARIARTRLLEEKIRKDSLTGLLKHASIKEAVDIEVQRAKRNGIAATVAMLDIDHFKLINDNYGHAKGDLVIAAVGTLLRQHLRKTDILGRYGGEEFVVVLPECDAETAALVMEDIRVRLSVLEFSHEGKTFHCTVSIGLACTKDSLLVNGSQVLMAADDALYKAKLGGRNQVQVSDSDNGTPVNS